MREVCKNLALVGQKFIKYGLAFLPCRSTLSDANANRDPNYFEQIYKLTYAHYCTVLRNTQFSLPIGGQVKISDVEVFDSTTITLLFSVIHRTIKQAEDFSTMVQVVAKKLCCYMDIVKFFTQTTKYCQDWYREEIRKVLLELFKI